MFECESDGCVAEACDKNYAVHEGSCQPFTETNEIGLLLFTLCVLYGQPVALFTQSSVVIFHHSLTSLAVVGILLSTTA